MKIEDVKPGTPVIFWFDFDEKGARKGLITEIDSYPFEVRIKDHLFNEPLYFCLIKGIAISVCIDHLELKNPNIK